MSVSAQELIKLICERFGITPDTVIKQKYRGLPEYTAKSVLERLLIQEHRSAAVTTIFPELHKDSLSKVLRNTFVGKSAKQPWLSYLLLEIGFKPCSTCNIIKQTGEFSISSHKISGYRSCCKDCESITGLKYRNNNENKIVEYKRQHYQDNKAHYTSKCIERTQLQARSTPPWANMLIMNRIYRDRPDGYHVDHIVPLNGELVCGLHCEHNLQYLPAAENISKHNKFDCNNYQHILPG